MLSDYEKFKAWTEQYHIAWVSFISLVPSRITKVFNINYNKRRYADEIWEKANKMLEERVYC